MSNEDIRQPLGTTPPTEQNLSAFTKLFPGVIREGVLDSAQLAGLLGVEVGEIKNGKEVFGLSWAGKKSSSQALQLPSYAALVPDFEKSINWDNAENVFIEGDNLEVLKLLKDTYNDKVKMIYIDPPYNTGNDFVYNDDFSDPKKRYLEVTGQVDAEGNRLTSNPETAGRKHSNWLSMMQPRLSLARNILRTDGVIFVSIDDVELHNLRFLMDEIFGAENFISILNWKKRSTGGQVANNAIIDQVEYVLLYARDVKSVKLRGLENSNSGNEKWRSFRKSGGEWQRRYRPNQFFPIYAHTDGRVSLEAFEGSAAVYPKDRNGEEGFWENGLSTTISRIERGEIRARMIGQNLSIEQREVSKETSNAGNFVDIPSVRGANEVRAIFDQVIFDNPKPVDLLDYCLQIAGTGDGDIVADFFAGSGSFGQAVLERSARLQQNLRFLLVNIREETLESKPARDAGYDFVSQITLERILRVIEGLKTREFGLRVLRLGPSNYEPYFPNDSGLFSLQARSKSQTYKHRAAAAEVLLKQGVELHQSWSGEQQIQSGSVLFLGDNVEGFEPSSLDSGVMVVVANEDAFEGKDSLKAKIHFDLKQMNKKLVTY